MTDSNTTTIPFCPNQLPAIQVPQFVCFFDTFPLTPTKKVSTGIRQDSRVKFYFLHQVTFKQIIPLLMIILKLVNYNQLANNEEDATTACIVHKGQ